MTFERPVRTGGLTLDLLGSPGVRTGGMSEVSCPHLLLLVSSHARLMLIIGPAPGVERKDALVLIVSRLGRIDDPK